MSERIELVVPTEQSGVRLDRFLARELAEISRTRIQELMDEGRVLVDGAAMKPSHKVEEGATVVIDIPPTLPAGVEAENIPLDLIYEDDDIAVINKPAGIIVHPGAGADTGTLVAALLHRFGGVGGLSTIGGPLRSGIVHRLDRLSALIVQPCQQPDSVTFFLVRNATIAGPYLFCIQPAEHTKSQSMESRVLAILDACPAAKSLSALETMEHLALLKRWYYRGSRVGEIFLVDDKNAFPMRRIVRGIGRVLRGEKREDNSVLESQGSAGSLPLSSS